MTYWNEKDKLYNLYIKCHLQIVDFKNAGLEVAQKINWIVIMLIHCTRTELNKQNADFDQILSDGSNQDIPKRECR